LHFSFWTISDCVCLRFSTRDWSEEEILEYNFGRHYLNNDRFRRRLEQELDYLNKYVCSRTLTSHPRQTSGHKVKAYPNTTPADKKCTILALHFEQSESRAWWSRHCLRLFSNYRIGL
jgi:hypothetical protein